MRSKKIIAACTASAYLLAIVPAFAQSASSTVGGNFCTNLPTISAKITEKLTERQKKISDHQTQINTKKADRWTSNDQKLSSKRSEADANRAQKYDGLEAKATTDAQKTAVATFQATVDAAVVTRKVAVDAAVKAYRDGVDAALTAHVTAMSSAQTAFQTAVNAATAQAQSDCTADSAQGATIRTAMHTSIKAAEATFKTARQDNKLEGTREALAATRKASIDAAMFAFKTTLDQARVTLKASFTTTP